MAVGTNSLRILLLGGISRSLINFRGPLIKVMLAAGHSVTAVAADYDPDVAATLESWGVTYKSVGFARAGMNPIADLATVGKLTQLIWQVNPTVFFGYTIKPVTYGLIAARLAGVPRRYAMITGLGYAFTDGHQIKRRIARIISMGCYRYALRYSKKVIFQNSDDQAFFLAHHLVRLDQALRVDGSGVDLNHYRPTSLPQGPMTFLLIARLLRDKGIYEYVEAARTVRRSFPSARFLLVGPLDPNPAAIKRHEIEQWQREGIIEYLGEILDVREVISMSHVYVLPSYYREGIPRTVLEAMAMGRAIITTDMPGCRETVVPSKNGYLIAPRNPEALSDAMMLFLQDRTLCRRMAEASLAIAQERFEADTIARATMSALELQC